MRVTHFNRAFGLQLVAALGLILSYTLSAQGQTQIVPRDSEWTFLSPWGEAENPEDSDRDFNTTWYKTGYDDSDWESGEVGPYHYGGIGGFGAEGLDILNDPGSGDRYTNYFRLEFTTNRAYASVGAEILADDGAVIYLDGQEITRFNCCTTADDEYLSFASAVGNEDAYATIPLVDNLAAGNHLLAVSVHQSGTTSSDLGFGMSLVTVPPPDPNAIASGIDTIVREGAPDTSYGTGGTWEWDADDGGANHGLLKFDIPADRLSGFGNGTATLLLNVANGGNSGEVYRMTADWLSGPNAGNNVTWDGIPGGPGVVPGGNALDAATVATGDAAVGDTLELDVTADVLAWASGIPQLWVGVRTDRWRRDRDFSLRDSQPAATDPRARRADRQGAEGRGCGHGSQVRPVGSGQGPDRSQVPHREAATWGDGDWNGAPGGTQGNPPRGDGFFNQLDIIAALNANTYLKGPYAAIPPGGAQGDAQTSIVYNQGTGEVSVDAPAGKNLTSVNIESASGIFTGAAQNLGGSFDNDTDNNVFKATFGGSFGSLSFGNVAQAGLTEAFVAGDLTVVGSLSGGGDLGAVDLVYVPEPSTVALLALGLLGLVARCWSKL